MVTQRRFEPVASVARRCHRDARTVRRWIAAGFLAMVKRLPAALVGREQLLVLVDDDGFPVWSRPAKVRR